MSRPTLYHQNMIVRILVKRFQQDVVGVIANLLLIAIPCHFQAWNFLLLKPGSWQMSGKQDQASASRAAGIFIRIPNRWLPDSAAGALFCNAEDFIKSSR